MPYSNGATLRFLLPGPFRGNAQDCNLARQSQSSDSVYRDEADDVLGSITPLAYRPMTNGIMADEDGEDDDGRHRNETNQGPGVVVFRWRGEKMATEQTYTWWQQQGDKDDDDVNQVI